MKQKSERNAPSLSAVYLLVMDLGREWGLRDADMLANTGISTELLHDPDARIALDQKLRLGRNIMNLSGHGDLGFAVGMRCRFISHGPIGYAAMSSPTLQDAIGVFSKYGWLSQEGIELHMRLDEDSMVITADGQSLSGSGRKTILEALFSTLYCTICFLLGTHQIPAIALHFAWPEPSYFKSYQGLLPGVRWAQPVSQICLPRALMSEELITANPQALVQAIKMVEQEMASCGRISENIAARVRAILQPSLYESPPLPDVAAQLCISTSTLKRRLRAGGHSYQAILDEVREEEARRLIKTSTLDLQEIADLLGFKDPACFTKAFRRWTGVNPSTMRKAG